MMTNKEAIKWLYAVINDPKTCGGNLEENNLALDAIRQDVLLVEQLKNILSKVVRVFSTKQEKREDGLTDYYLHTEYKVGEDFDIKAFKDIIDALGYELVKK